MIITQPEIKANKKISNIILASITIIAYLLAQIIHEGMGHGGLALLLGAKITQVTNTNLQYDSLGVSILGSRVIASGGTVANVIAGVLALWYLRSMSIKSANLRFFLWLLGHINLFKGFGYLLITFAPIGDWHDAAVGLPSQTIWMAGLTLLGAITSLGTFFYAAQTIDEFIGKDIDRRKRAFTLTLFPYLLGGTVNVLATIIGLGVSVYTFTGALATFGGTFLMVWLGFAVGYPKPNTPLEPVTPFYNTGWFITGVIAIIFYLFWFGSGLL
ncbi:MAG: hypothetical protein U0Z26_09195 [Anaerolineales bacterium]